MDFCEYTHCVVRTATAGYGATHLRTSGSHGSFIRPGGGFDQPASPSLSAWFSIHCAKRDGPPTFFVRPWLHHLDSVRSDL